MNRTTPTFKSGGFTPWRCASASAMSMLLLLGQTAPLLANPTGGAVVAGSATIGAAGLTLNINQSTQNAIINWQSFSIANGETTKFVVPNSGATLNRVTGGNLSAIYGSLQSNGTVYLLNPNGIVVGPSGQINTAGFLASTLDLSNEDFLSGGDKHFTGSSSAAIKNAGVIHASTGDVYLIANQVKNSGTISAPQGNVGLAAGNDVLFQQAGSQHLFVTATPNTAKRATGITNTGTIQAAAAELKAAGGNAYALAINNSGVIAATGYKKVNGQVYLTSDGGSVTNSGKISAKQANGNGGTIALNATATTPAPSATSPAPVAQVASTGTVTNSGTLDASATVAKGIGGTITIKDMTGGTIFTGTIVAKGGQGGAGGNAEISGGSLHFGGLVDLTAPLGATGNLLFDPENVVIQVAGPSTTTFSGGTFTGSTPNSVLTVADLDAALATANVTVTTGAAGSAGTQGGDITVNNAVSWAGATTLTLSAYRNITLNASVTTTGGGGITLRADNSGTGTGTIAFNAGAVVNTSGLVTFYYNPTSYTAPTDFAGDVAGGATVTPFMLVNNLTDLQNMQTNLAGDYALSGNIDATSSSTLNSGAGFAPIGGSGTPFTGVFNGQGFVINGLYINLPGSNSVGLFGAINDGSTVENINLTNVHIDGNSDVGGIVGWIQTAGTNVLKNSSTSGSVFGENDGFAIGGLVGANDGLVDTDISDVAVTLNGTTTIGEVAGLVGYNYTTGTVNNSTSSGTVTADSSTPFVSNIVGENLGTITGTTSTSPPPSTGTGTVTPPPDNITVTGSMSIDPNAGRNILPPALTPQTTQIFQPNGPNLGDTIDKTPQLNFAGTGISQADGQGDSGLAGSTGNSGQVKSGDAAQLGHGQLNNVNSRAASGALNFALGPAVYHNLTDAMQSFGGWTDITRKSGDEVASADAASDNETIVGAGGVVEMAGAKVKKVAASDVPLQLRNAMEDDFLEVASTAP